jgi:hypothetical protein
MPKVQLTGRLTALAGVGAAFCAAALVTFAGPAMAADNNKTTSCTDKVNVRSEPSSSGKVIGSCGAGEKVTTDRSESGYSHLASKNGWVSNQYLKDADSSDGSDDNNNGDDNNDDSGHHHHHHGSSHGGGLFGGF